MKLNEISSPPDVAATIKTINDFLQKGKCTIQYSKLAKTSIGADNLDKQGNLNLRNATLRINNARRKELRSLPPQIINLKSIYARNVDIRSWDALPVGLEKLVVENGNLPNPESIPDSIKVLNLDGGGFDGPILSLYDGSIDVNYLFREDNADIAIYTLGSAQGGGIYVVVESFGDQNEFHFASVFELQEWMMDNNLEAYV